MIASGSGRRISAKKPKLIAETPTTPRAMWLNGCLVDSAVRNSPRQANSASTGKTAKKERKKTISPAGTWPASLMVVDMPTKTATEATFNPMPTSVLVRRAPSSAWRPAVVMTCGSSLIVLSIRMFRFHKRLSAR